MKIFEIFIPELCSWYIKLSSRAVWTGICIHKEDIVINVWKYNTLICAGALEHPEVLAIKEGLVPCMP